MRYATALFFAFIIVLGTASLWAHGGNDHIMGTVTAIDANHIEVKTPKGETISLQLSEKTMFYSKNTPPPNGRPRVGDRVVIDARKDGGALKALEMEFSTPTAQSKEKK